MIVTINTITAKKSSNGKPYHSVDTNKGIMSVWDGELAKDIEEKCLGKTMDVAIKESGKYKNIIGVNGEATSFGVVDNAPPKTSGEAIGESAKIKRKAEMMRCAVDVCMKKNGFTDGEILAQFKWFMEQIGEPIEEKEEEKSTKPKEVSSQIM
jgi:2,3-bisphosphoglycerate-independent phosphoglycerate mutase